MSSRNQILACICILFFAFGANAQLSEGKGIPLSILAQSQNTAFPFTPNFYGFNPSITIGTDIDFRKMKDRGWLSTFSLGAYYNRNWETAILLNAHIGYKLRIKRLGITPKFGVSYVHSISTRPVYRYKGDQYKRVTDFGSPNIMGTLSMEIEYKLRQDEKSPSIFINLTNGIRFPLNFFTSTQQYFGIGYKFWLNS